MAHMLVGVKATFAGQVTVSFMSLVCVVLQGCPDCEVQNVLTCTGTST